MADSADRGMFVAKERAYYAQMANKGAHGTGMSLEERERARYEAMKGNTHYVKGTGYTPEKYTKKHVYGQQPPNRGNAPGFYETFAR